VVDIVLVSVGHDRPSQGGRDDLRNNLACGPSIFDLDGPLKRNARQFRFDLLGRQTGRLASHRDARNAD
jgi:hypothetical protein